MSLSWALSVQAQNTYTIIVNSEVDADLATLNANTTCDLREAIDIANTGVDTGADCAFTPIGAIDLTADDFIIRFDMTAGAVADELTIPLQTPLPTITSTVDIGGYALGSPSATSLVVIEPATPTGTGIGLAFGVNAGNNAINADSSKVSGLIIRNFGIGVQVNSVVDVEIGDSGAPLTGLRNYIYSNQYGIDIRGTDAQRTIVRNNSIGVTEVNGTAGNAIHGIFVHMDAQVTSIGGVNADDGNIVGANGNTGIYVSSSDDVTIANNVVGIPLISSSINIGNGSAGIYVTGSVDVDIDDNTVGYSGTQGIVVDTSPSTFMRRNNVGTLPNTTTPIPNTLDGILIQSSNDSNIDGGLVFNNLGNGISVTTSTEVTIEETLIFNNGGIGIDLNIDGVTFNDGTADADGGANNSQNFPEFQSAGYDAGANSLTILLDLPVTGTNFDTLYYVNPAGQCDATTGYGEGRNRLLDAGTPSFLVTTGGGTFTDILSGTYNVGDQISAVTINRTTGETSEFAQCIAITSDTLVANFTPLATTINEGSAVSFTNLSTGAITDVTWFVNNIAQSSTFDFTQTFATPGTYNIRLEIENSATGGSDSITGVVTVLAIPPTATPLPPPNTPVPQNTDVPPPTVPTDIPTQTLVPSQTPIPTRTLIPTRTPVPTRTLRPTATDVPPTATLIPTATDLPPTATLIPTQTLVPTITGTPALAVTVVGDGENEMEVVVVNVGDNAANNVLIQEVLRAGVEFRAAIPGAPICTEVGGIVACQIGTVVGGGAASVNFTVQTDGQAPDSGITIVTADGVAPQIIDEPFISKIGSPPVAEPGSEITYTIRVINPTDESAFDMVIQDIMPDIIDILDAEASAGTLDIDGQNIRLELDELAAGERVILTIQALVRDDEDAQEIRNTACVTSSSNPDPNCAVMSFLAVETLPPSGEINIAFKILRALGIAVLAFIGLFGGHLLYRRVYR